VLEQEGRVWFRRALSVARLNELDAAAPSEGKPGARIAALGGLEDVDALALQLLPGARPVRVVAFNKTKPTTGRSPGIKTASLRCVSVSKHQASPTGPTKLASGTPSRQSS